MSVKTYHCKNKEEEVFEGEILVKQNILLTAFAQFFQVNFRHSPTFMFAIRSVGQRIDNERW